MNRSTLVVALASALLGGGGGYAMRSPQSDSRPAPQAHRPAPGASPAGQARPRPSSPARPQAGSGEITTRTPFFFPPPGIDLGGYGWYGYPYPYGYDPYPYPYPAPWYVESGASGSGEVRLDVSQKDATVYVDGFYVGVVDDFNGIFHHLKLTAGPQRIEIRKPGYETLVLDVNAQPNQTITYRDVMQPAAADVNNTASPATAAAPPAADTTRPMPGAPLPRMVVGAPGEVLFEVSPKEAQVYVDGFYVGTIDNFNGRSQRLTLPPGPHHLVMRATGYEDLEVDMNIQPRQTMTYRGDLKQSASRP